MNCALQTHEWMHDDNVSVESTVQACPIYRIRAFIYMCVYCGASRTCTVSIMLMRIPIFHYIWWCMYIINRVGVMGSFPIPCNTCSWCVGTAICFKNVKAITKFICVGWSIGVFPNAVTLFYSYKVVNYLVFLHAVTCFSSYRVVMYVAMYGNNSHLFPTPLPQNCPTSMWICLSSTLTPRRSPHNSSLIHNTVTQRMWVSLI